MNPPPPERPSRPPLVELATALLVVSGFMSFVLTISAFATLADRTADVSLALLALSVAIAFVTIAVGIALRYGRWWLFGVNLVAVAAFLELTSGTPAGLLFGAIDLFVVVVLLVNRPWFTWTPDDGGREPAQRP